MYIYIYIYIWMYVCIYIRGIGMEDLAAPSGNWLVDAGGSPVAAYASNLRPLASSLRQHTPVAQGRIH